MTVGDLLDDLNRDFGFQVVPMSAVATRFRGYLQKAHLAILREPGFQRLRDTLQPLTISSVVARAVYGLPASLTRIYTITERDNDRVLDSKSLEELRATDPGLTATGTPYCFVPLGYGPISLNPASTGIWVASDSSSDTTQTAQINGVRTAGLPSGDVTATLNGTTRVALGTLTDYVDVQSITISSSAVGTVSFFDAAVSGNTIAQIPIGQITPNYLRVQLYPTPEAVIVYYVDGQYTIPTLNDLRDVPLLPEEFHDVLTDYARMCEYERLGDDQRFAMAQGRYTVGLNRLKFHVLTSPAETFVMGSRGRRRFSRFGPWAPADSPWP